MIHRSRKMDPFDPNLFQARNSNELFRLGVKMSPSLKDLTPFPKEELAKLKELEPKLEGIDIHKLPLLYTTQMPIRRGTLIDMASSEMFLAVPPASKNGNGESASTVVALEKLVADYKLLSAEKLNSGFLSLMVEKVENGLKNIKIDDDGDFLKQSALKKKGNFEKLVKDIEFVLKTMHENGMDSTSIYKKLTVDLGYLNDMQGFISNAIKKVQSVRLDLNKKYLSLERRKKNLEDALDKTETKTVLDKLITLGKLILGSAFVGAATFITARGEALKILEKLSDSPNLVFIGIGLGLAVLGVLVYISMETLKAFQKNHFTKVFDKKEEKVIKKAVDYTRRNLKVIGYKATKEAAFTGYLEALQGEASETYLAAAYQADFDVINRIYDRQVDRMLGERTFLSRIAGLFRRNTEKKMDAALGKIAVSVDGSFVDVQRGTEAGNAGAP
ncbi:MAG: hypothetical protein NTX79_01130 [Candidatus Micrarchaeota archaeon]|nr:hypothetical protein [Candidatus Micrarchaeota archaeon]